MKQIIIIAILLIGTFNTIAQDTISNDKNQLELIADELDISESQAYSTLVQEQRVQAYRNLMIFVAMFLSIWTLTKSLKLSTKPLTLDKETFSEYYQAVEKASDTASWSNIKETLRTIQGPWASNSTLNNNMAVAKKVIFIVLSLGIFISSFIYNSVYLSETFTGLFNPEYGALEQLNFLTK
jgi:hypothetical protein